MKGRELRRVLRRAPLSYREPGRGTGGSHTKLTSDQYPTVLFSFHDNADVPRRAVRKVLVQDVGLTEQAALGILRG